MSSTLPTPRAAPGELKLVQDFVNTARPALDEDDLRTPGDLARWLGRRDLVPEGAPIDEAGWRTAIEVRDSLRALIGAGDGAAIDRESLARLNTIFGGTSHRMRFRSDGSLHLEPTEAQAGWSGVAYRMLLAVFEAKTSGRWWRLKLCQRDGCRQVFYDGSRNRNGKWCDTRRCGARLHSQTYRRRERTGRSRRLTDNLIR